MITTIEYGTEEFLNITTPGVLFSCKREDYCRTHEGIWNSRVLAFVPQQSGPLPSPLDGSENYYGIKRRQDTGTFSDGTPVASYDELADNPADHCNPHEY